jgi:hypothetical protein
MAGLPWIPLHTSFPASRKAVALGIVLGNPLAWAYAVRTWTWFAEHAPSGSVEGPDAVAVIEHAAGWTGTQGELVAALCLPHIRLLDEKPKGFAVHDWHEHCGAHVEKRERERTRLKTYRNRTRTERVPNAVATTYVHGEREREKEKEREKQINSQPAIPINDGNERLPSWLAGIKKTLEQELNQPLGVGKNAHDTVRAFKARRAHLSAEGNPDPDSTLVGDCLAIAGRSRTGPPASLSFFVGWFDRVTPQTHVATGGTP